MLANVPPRSAIASRLGALARARALARALALVGLVTIGCDPASSGPAPAPPPEPAPSYDPSWEATRDPARRAKRLSAAPASKQPVDAKPVVPVAPSPDDPLGGRWSLAEALEGLEPGTGLEATVRTARGELRCTLWPDKAPIAVANFVGLARGLRPWKTPDGSWQKRPAYDGSFVSRIIPGLLLQGGSPDAGRDTDPGYAIPDEIWQNASHDRAGLLCVASLGRNRGGMQFAITLGPAFHLDHSFPIFGQCGPLDVLQHIAAVPTDRGRPREPLRIESVRIHRGR